MFFPGVYVKGEGFFTSAPKNLKQIKYIIYKHEHGAYRQTAVTVLSKYMKKKYESRKADIKSYFGV